MKPIYFISFTYTKFGLRKFANIDMDTADGQEINSMGFIKGAENVLREKGYKNPVILNFKKLN